MSEHSTQFAFKGMRDHTAKVNRPDMSYQNQHIDIPVPNGL